MKLDEAIGILQFNGAPEEGPTISDFIEARNLGIEALKCIKEHRAEFGNIPFIKLSGETTE